MSLPHQRSYIIDVDAIVFKLVIMASCIAIGYWWGAEAQTEVRVIRIPERVTPTCIEKGALKKMIYAYAKEAKNGR
jgi:hypothetical protein